MSTITWIEITHHQLPPDPPFPASWDTPPPPKSPAPTVPVAAPVRRGGGGAPGGLLDPMCVSGPSEREGDSVIGRVGTAVPDVVGDGAVEQKPVLRHHHHPAAQ